MVRASRLSIGLMMVATAVIALDFAFVRFALAHRGPDLAAVYGPIGVATQVGFALATHGPAGRRRFWSGFSIGGACALAAQAWLELAQPGPVAELWGAYTTWLDRVFGRLPRLGASNPGHELLHFAVVASFFFPAQLLLASAGGVLASGSDVIRRSRRVANGRTA
jgi:hypothetical protein